MADTRIPLMGQVADTTTVFPLFQEARQASQRNELFPLVKQQQQTATDQAQLNYGQDVEGAINKTFIQGALSIKPKLDRGDVQGAYRDMLMTKESMIRQGLPTQRIDQAIQSFQQDPANFKAAVDDIYNSIQGPAESYTLSEGQVRFGPDNQPVAGVPKSEDPEKTQPLIKDLRNRYDKFTADLRDVDAAYRKVNDAPATAAGDLSLIFNYMKMLDPGSTVREGEFANAQNTGGIDSKVYNLYNNILTGERLSPDQRSQFKETAQTAFKAQQDSADQQIADLLSQADADGLDRERVLGAKALREFEKRAADRLISQQKQPPPADVLSKAQAAIQAGADPEKVRKRIEDSGYSSEGL